MATATTPQSWTVRITISYRKADGTLSAQVVTGRVRGSEQAVRTFIPRKVAALKGLLEAGEQFVRESVSYQAE